MLATNGTAESVPWHCRIMTQKFYKVVLSTVTQQEENTMIKRPYLFALLLPLVFLSVSEAQQYPLMDMIANKVIQKYQQSTCEQLWQKKEKPQPKLPEEQNAIQILKSDPQMRTAFINKVAAPIANKMFECGMIP